MSAASTHLPSGMLKLAQGDPQAFAGLVALAGWQAEALGRIAGAYEALLLGASDQDRVIEVVRQELRRLDTKASRVRRLSRPVRG